MNYFIVMTVQNPKKNEQDIVIYQESVDLIYKMRWITNAQHILSEII